MEKSEVAETIQLVANHFKANIGNPRSPVTDDVMLVWVDALEQVAQQLKREVSSGIQTRTEVVYRSRSPAQAPGSVDRRLQRRPDTDSSNTTGDGAMERRGQPGPERTW